MFFLQEKPGNILVKDQYISVFSFEGFPKEDAAYNLLFKLVIFIVGKNNVIAVGGLSVSIVDVIVILFEYCHRMSVYAWAALQLVQRWEIS